MKRVLFIDDDQAVLDGLRRTLRSRRGEWEMRFVRDPDEALGILSADPVDVIVSDMHMPGMDGAQFLTQVKCISPRTVRLFLSGNVTQEASLKSACVSHQFLAKPCDPEVLQDVIERACALEDLLGDPALQEVLGEVGGLPALPKTFRALSEALAQPEVDLQVVSSIVEQDQAIAAKILQVVNSSFFSLRREIHSVHQATTYLGASMVRDLVLSAEIARHFGTAEHPAGFSLERQQQHSLCVSRVARRLCEDRAQADQAFLAGMLHDIGLLVMASYFPAQLRDLVAASKDRRMRLHELEREQGLVGHGVIGAYLLGLWGMSYPIVEAAAFHHLPERAFSRTGLGVPAIVHVADALVGELEGEPDAGPDEDLLERLGVAERLDAWRAIAAEECERGRSAA